MKIGYVKIHRKLVEWRYYKNSVVKCIFLHILLTANYKDVPWEEIIVKKGQKVTSYPSLAEETGFTVAQVRKAIAKLKEAGTITVRTTSRYSLITVENWDLYQSQEENGADKRAVKKTVKEQTESSQGAVREHQVKNIKNNKNINNNICAPAKKNKFCNFEQKPIDYEAVRQKNLEKLMKALE